jgi:chemotaxis protein methyltransferase CheR
VGGVNAALARALPMADLERILEGACGLAFAKGAARCLADGFAKAAHDADLAPEAFLQRLLRGDEESVTALVENAVVGETYFFRHPEQFEALRKVLLDPTPPTPPTSPTPPASQGRPLSAWSAGCATGEEPYTIAMALLEAGRAGCPDRILATDVSSRALESAATAVYGPWSLRRIDPGIRARHFEGRPPRETVVRAVRERVRFQRHNLVRDPVPGSDFDLVVCRNVLIYFRPQAAATVVAKLFSAVRPGGVLLLGPVETPVAQDLAAQRIELGAATLLRKPLPGEVVQPAPPAAPPPGRRRRTDRAAPTRAARAAPAARRPEPTPGPAARTDSAARPPRPFELAREAARRGDHAEAERLARESAARDLCAECYLLVAVAAEARGDLAAAVEAARRALYLEPDLAMAHATLLALYRRLGRTEDAARARRNALRAIEGLDDATELRGVEPVTAGALRAALNGSDREAYATPGGRA